MGNIFPHRKSTGTGELLILYMKTTFGCKSATILSMNIKNTHSKSYGISNKSEQKIVSICIILIIRLADFYARRESKDIGTAVPW